MKYEKEFNNVFKSSGNEHYTKRLILDIESNLKDATADNRGISSKNGPDLVYKINNRNFFRIKKSCSIDFFLQRGASYNLLKTESSTSTHTHNISGSSFKNLNEAQYKVIFYYIIQS